MIKIEKTETYGWEAAIRGMRNPMNSWDQLDSRPGIEGNPIWIGAKDGALMKKLVAAGTDHSKFMRMITATADVTALLYWWKEFDTYKVGTVANSCSSMHHIHEKEFNAYDFSFEHLLNENVVYFGKTLERLNNARKQYLETKDKCFWWQMIQLLPTSYNQRRTIQLNYAVLRNIYHARKDHPLDEWRDFCKWIEGLHYSELITE